MGNVSSDHAKMYKAARDAGSKLVQGEGTWAGIMGQGQVLIAKTKNAFVAVDESGNVEKLEGDTKEKAAESAKTLLGKGGSKLSDLAAIPVSQETKSAMQNAQNGGGDSTSTGTKPEAQDVSNTSNASSGNTPTNKNDAVTAQAQKKAAWAALQQKLPQNLVDIKDKNGKDTKILVVSKDGGKTYVAVDSNLNKEIPMKTVTSKDPKQIYADNKALIDAEVPNGFGEEAAELPGSVNQVAPSVTNSTEPNIPATNTAQPGSGTTGTPATETETPQQPTSTPTNTTPAKPNSTLGDNNTPGSGSQEQTV